MKEKKPMRIAVMLRTLEEKQGIGVYARNLMSAVLNNDKRNHYIFIYVNSEQLGSFGDHENLSEVVCQAKGKLLWDHVTVPRIAKQYNADIIFNTKFSIPLLTFCKTMMVFHGSEWFVYPQFYNKLDILYNKLLLPVYSKKAAAISCVSKITADDMAQFTGIDPKKLHVIHSSIASHFAPVEDQQDREKFRTKYKLPDKYILFVGKIYPGKNFSNILRAFRKIKDDLGNDIKLVSVGDMRWDYAREMALVTELGLKDDIQFTGWVEQEELPAIYSLAELFLFPSYYEGFGIPILEAMACGCPVVTANTGACPEVAGGAAALVDPDDPGDIANSVLQLIKDKNMQDNLVRNGLKRVEAFSWDKAAKETINVFDEISD